VTPRARDLIGLLLGLFVIGVPVWAMLSSSGCGAPPTPARVAKAADDLCVLRAVERSVLELDPNLAPPADTFRAKLQRTEDEFCASLADAEAPPPMLHPLPDASAPPIASDAAAPPPAPD
jgi:hypothetical protein